jgi:uncharacterized membrane protein YpjA
MFLHNLLNVLVQIANKIGFQKNIFFKSHFICSTSNIEILERFQLKALHMIVDAPWYVPNMVIRRDLQIPTVEEDIHRYSSQYSARLSTHQNYLTVNLIWLPDNG